MKNEKFSVVIPSYNTKNYLKKAIDSVLNQTYQPFEIIIIDNNSIDGSQDYIKSLKNKRIKLFKIENFGSIAKSRNIGIEKSSGNWISFLDSDDYWHPQKLEQVREVIIELQPDMVSHNTYNINKNDRIISSSKYGQTKISVVKHLLTRGSLYHTSAVSLKKEFLKKNKLFFDERLAVALTEDYDLWTRIVLNKGKVCHIERRLSYYRMHDKNNSSDIKIFKAALFVKKKNLEYVLIKGLFKINDLLEIVFFYYLYKYYVKSKQLAKNISSKIESIVKE